MSVQCLWGSRITLSQVVPQDRGCQRSSSKIETMLFQFPSLLNRGFDFFAARQANRRNVQMASGRRSYLLWTPISLLVAKIETGIVRKETGSSILFSTIKMHRVRARKRYPISNCISIEWISRFNSINESNFLHFAIFFIFRRQFVVHSIANVLSNEFQLILYIQLNLCILSLISD